MENFKLIEPNKSLSETIENLKLFNKLNSSETAISFLEFRTDLHAVVSHLIKLWHEVNLQAIDQKHVKIYDELKQTIIKSLVDCSYSEDRCLRGRLPEWEQIFQEEKLRKDITRILTNLTEKLKFIQKDLQITHTKHSKNNHFSIVGGIM